MSVLAQGEAYIKKKINKIDGMFASKQEGFSGILGPNAELEYVNQTDYAKTAVSVNKLNTNINAYQNATTALQNRTNLYLNSQTTPAPGDPKRNYNVFINKSVAVTATSPVSARTAGASAAGGGAGAASAAAAEIGAQCVSLAALEDFTDSSGNGFDNAYPENFSLFDDAKKACQIWAADLGFKFFGVTQQNAEFKCYTSNKAPRTTPKNFTTPKPLYTVATKLETTRGGLFANGQIGVYRSAKAAQWLIQNMNKPIYYKHYNNAKYTSSEPTPLLGPASGAWGNGGVDWNGVSLTSGGKSMYWGTNKFPNDKNAWWVGDVFKDKTTGATWSTASANMAYFYYVYNAPPAGRQVGVYLVVPQYSLPPPGYTKIYQPGFAVAQGDKYTGVLKINGVQMLFTPDPPYVNVTADPTMTNWINSWLPGLTVSIKLAPGKNVFELPRYSGFPTSGFVMYVYDSATNEILFRSGDPGWGVMDTKVPNWNMISNIPETAQSMADPYLFTTANTEPNGFSTCDKLIGGNINIKTINATYGKNCSNSTKKPLNVRYIRITPNGISQNIQISQLVVMAFLNGVQVNVANKGTITSSTSLGNTDPLTPVNGKTDNILYWSSDSTREAFWQLDLAIEYPLVSITFYNRTTYNDYADGMKINFQDKNGEGYTLKNPVILTGQLVQTFNVSVNDIFLGSPNYRAAPPGAKNLGLLGYGFTSLAQAKEQCESQGQRMCRRSEIALYTVCAASWNGDGGTTGYPMVLGDPFCQGADGICGWCGGMAPGQPGYSPWVTWSGAAGVYCCDNDHTGAYDPTETQITRKW